MKILSCLILTLISVSALTAQTERKVNTDPNAVKFVTSDIDNFYRAFDLASKETDIDRKAEIYQKEYFDKGSDGLKDFIRLRLKTSKDFATIVEKLPRFYVSVRPSAQKVASMEKKLRSSFRKFKRLYPDAVFPDVYFMIGNTSTGGTTGPSGLLIGTELYSLSDATPIADLPEWMQKVISPITKIPAIVAHESCHYNQDLERQTTVLAKSIQEGSCDLVSELVSGGIINDKQKAWAEPRQAELWREFSAEMNTDKIRNWMYNGTTVKDRPGDLGYYIGYKITAAYYKKAKDKKKAMKDIMTIKDFQRFLNESGYAPVRPSA